MADQRVDLVLEGGGIKGVGLAGALSVLEREGFQAQNLAGASAGAIIAALYAVGYTAADLRELVRTLDFRSFQDGGWDRRLPGGGTSRISPPATSWCFHATPGGSASTQTSSRSGWPCGRA